MDFGVVQVKIGIELARARNFRVQGYRSFYYSNEGTPHKPVHVHVEENRNEAKFWIYTVVQVAYNDG